MKRFAHEFYRGIASNPENFDPNGYLTKAAFQFKRNKKRCDNYEEMSINWNDSRKSLDALMKAWNERKNCFLASYGYVCLSLSFVHKTFTELLKDKKLSYERKAIRRNIFTRRKLSKRVYRCSS